MEIFVYDKHGIPNLLNIFLNKLCWGNWRAIWKKNIVSCGLVLWLMPVTLTFWEVEAGKLPQLRSSRPVCGT